MGLQVKRLFCLLVCCELSSLLNGSPNLSCRDCEQSSSSENLLSSRTRPEDLLSSRTRPKDHLSSRTTPEGLLSSSKRFEDLLRSRTRPENLLSFRTRPEDLLTPRTRPEYLLTPRTRPEDLLSSRTRTEDLLSSTTRPDQDLLTYRINPEDLLSSRTRTEDRVSSRTRPEHLPQRDASHLQAQRSSSRPLLQKEPSSHPRHKRGTSTDPEHPPGDHSGAQKLVETLPKPLAQNQSTYSPGDFTLDNGLFTVPEGDYQDFTPLVPLSTRPKTPGVKNPFYPLTGDSYGAYAIMFISIIIFTVGIIGNIAIMCIVCHNYYMRSISNSLLANLALWDFLIVFFCLPLVIFHELTKDWLLGEFSCKIVPYIEVASLGVTTFTLCALCIDRFRAASNVQMYYEMIENCASTAAKLAVIWIGALLLALPELLIHQLVREEHEPPEVTPCERCVVRISTALPDTLYVLGLTYNGARLWWYFGCYFCLPTIFTIISSVVTAQKIRKAERVSVRGNRKQIHLESQMNCMVVALAILYGFCAIPENICNIMSVYMAAGVPRRTLDIMHLVSQMLLFCKSAVTPVLLLALCKPFGRAFLDCCCCCWEECGPPKSSTATSDDNEHECTTELELSPFSTMRRETSTYTAAGTHC